MTGDDPRTPPVGGVVEPPRLRPPPPDLFARRAARLNHLAGSHDLREFLRYGASLASAQQAALEARAVVAPPDPALLAHCRTGGLPPLALAGWQPEPPWPALARDLAAAVLADAGDWLPAPARAGCERVRTATDDWLLAQARGLLGDPTGPAPDLAAAPLVGGALQVAWTTAAARLGPDDIGAPASDGLCPVCGSPPVTGILRAGGALDGLRYLHCGLCASEWHVVRSQCSQCGNSRGITYLGIDAWGTAVQAEACPACRTYVKLCRMDQDLAVEPWADDLATLALDWLVDQEGFHRAGLHFLLLGPEAAS